MNSNNATNLSLALQIMYDLLRHASEVSALIGQAHAENRDLTDVEVNGIATSDELARARLQAAIDDEDFNEVDPPAPGSIPASNPLDAGHLD